MKNLFKQLGKAACYFLLFIISQTIFTNVLYFYYSFQLGVEAGQSGEIMTAEKMNALLLETMEMVTAASPIIVILAAVLTILLLWVFFTIRKKKLLHEVGILPVSRDKWIVLIAIGLGMGLFFTGGLSLLPIPESVLEEYASASSALLGQPLYIALLSNVIVAPLVEEIIFRGLMLSRLRKAMPVAVAMIISSAVFGLVHGQLLWMAYTFVMGLMFAIVAVKTNSVLSSIVLHMIFNLIGTVLSATGWEPTVLALVIMCVIGAIFLAVGFYILFFKKNFKKAVQPSYVS